MSPNRSGKGELTAPVEPGRYELRYVLGGNNVMSDKKVLARATVTVIAPPPVKIEAPATVEAGAVFAFAWTGPNNPIDGLMLVPVGAPVNSDGGRHRASASRSGKEELTAPVEPGRYELRYVLGGDRIFSDKKVLARVPIVVVEASAK